MIVALILDPWDCLHQVLWGSAALSGKQSQKAREN